MVSEEKRFGIPGGWGYKHLVKGVPRKANVSLTNTLPWESFTMQLPRTGKTSCCNAV